MESFWTDRTLTYPWEFKNGSSLPPFCESTGIWRVAWRVLCLYLFPVGQRKTRDAPDDSHVQPDANKSSDKDNKKADKTNNESIQDKIDTKPVDQKKEDQTEEKPNPAEEAKKVEEKEFQVRDVCVYVCVCVICSWNQFLICICF